MNSKNKAQVSIEMLIIVGIVVLGAIIFATYYLSSVNRNIDTVTDLDSDLSGIIPSEEMGSTTQVPDQGGGSIGGGGSFNLCGNGQVNPPEQCDGGNLGGATCQSLGYDSGSLTCLANCQFNLNSCGVAPTHFTIVSSAVGPGTITPLGSTQVIAGGNQTYIFQPDPGKIISSVSVDSMEVQPISSTYTFSTVLMNHTIEVTFEDQPVTHIILATAGSNGLISPSGNVVVADGDDQTFTFSPDAGYRVGSVLIDNVAIGGGEIGVIAELSSKENSDKEVLSFSDVDEKITLNFAANNPIGVVAANQYVFEDVTENHSIHVTFVPIATPTYTLTYNAGANGTIDGITSQTISEGGYGSEVTAVPNAGYTFSSWSDGSTSASRTDGPITTDETFTASFVVDPGNSISFNLDPDNSSAVQNQNFAIEVDSTDSSSALRFDLTVLVFKGPVPSNDCRYNGVNSSTFNLETNRAPEVKSYNFSCDVTGNYEFRFTVAQTSNPANKLEKSSLWNITSADVVATPVVNPVGGTYYNDQSVSLSTTTPGAEIRYTTNATNPTCSSGTVYSSPISITTTTNLRAIACKTGSTPSSVISENYFLKVDTPQPSVTPGYYSTAQTVSLSTITTGAQIYYSLDGADPDSTTGILYTTPFVIATPYTELKATAYKTGYQDSSEFDGVYYITGYSNSKDVAVYRPKSASESSLIGDKAITFSSVELVDEVNNLVLYTNPKIDGNFLEGSPSSNQTYNCDFFCNDMYDGGICEDFTTINYQANANDLLYVENPIIDGTMSGNEIIRRVANTPKWRYPNGNIGGPIRFNTITCDFSKVPSYQDEAPIDLYEQDYISGVPNTPVYKYDSAKLTADNISVNGNQYTYTNPRVVANTFNIHAQAMVPTDPVYLTSEYSDYASLGSAYCAARLDGGNYVSHAITYGAGISVVHYDNFITSYPSYAAMPSGEYWYVSQFANSYTGNRISQIVCSK